MLIKRTITALVLAAIGIPVIILGGPYYFALITFFLAVAAWEYGRMFDKAGCKVPGPLLIGCVVLIAAGESILPWPGSCRADFLHPGCHDLAPA